MSDIDIHRVKLNNKKDIEYIREAWKALETGKDMTVYQSYEWSGLLLEEELCNKEGLFKSSIYAYMANLGNDETVCILPIIVQTHSSLIRVLGREKGIYILGHRSYSDYLNAIYSDKADQGIFQRIIEKIQEDFKGYDLFVTDIRSETKFASFLKTRGYMIINEQVAVQVKRRKTVDEYNQSLSKSAKQNLRTSKNRLEKAGLSYRFEVLGMTEDESLISKLVKLHIKRMIEKNSDTTSLKKSISNVLQIHKNKHKEQNNNIIAESMRCMQNSFLLICYLNDDIAGYLYGLYDNKTIRIMQNCLNSEYKFYSPIYRAAYDYILSTYDDDSIKIVDFTRGNEKYKYDLGGEEVLLYSFNVK